MRRCSATTPLLRLVAGLAAVAGALAAAPYALACGSSGYTYAGLASTVDTHGVGARLTAIGAPSVKNGHVAGWVGVGGPKQGPHGRDEWIQVGFNGFQGSTDSNLYYEVNRAGSAPRYVEVESNLPQGTSRRVAVLELGSHKNWWRVWVDGRPVSKAIYLPASDGAWQGIATAESWGGAGRPVCNGFGYRFDDIKIAPQAGGAWRTLAHALPIQTGGYQLLRPSTSSFEAISGRLLKPALLKVLKPLPQPLEVSTPVRPSKAAKPKRILIADRNVPADPTPQPAAAQPHIAPAEAQPDNAQPPDSAASAPDPVDNPTA
jgi:hypothetical protein